MSSARLLTVLLGTTITRAVGAAKSVPFSTRNSYDCVNNCIDEGYTFCPTGLFGYCCEFDRCGDTSKCSKVNRNVGAKYLTCIQDDFCGQRNYEVSDIEKLQFTFQSLEFSPASACTYSFSFGREANLGDIMNVELEDLTRLDLYYAEGANSATAKGRQVNDPVAGLFKVRFPNNLYITLVNKDQVRTPIEKPIKVTFWREPVDPSLKFDEYSADQICGKQDDDELVCLSTDRIPPQFAIPLTTLRSQKTVVSEDDDLSALIWVTFAVALALVASICIVYYLMRERRRKMLLQKALAEGKVTLKDIEQMNTDGMDADQNENAPDKQVVEMTDRNSTPYSRRNDESQRGMLNSADMSDRFGSAHANELAMEYFQSASVAGKSPDQMIQEFKAIQRYKEEELVQMQLNQAPANALEDMIADAADESEMNESPERRNEGLLTDQGHNDPIVDSGVPDKTV